MSRVAKPNARTETVHPPRRSLMSKATWSLALIGCHAFMQKRWKSCFLSPKTQVHRGWIVSFSLHPSALSLSLKMGNRWGDASWMVYQRHGLASIAISATISSSSKHNVLKALTKQNMTSFKRQVIFLSSLKAKCYWSPFPSQREKNEIKYCVKFSLFVKVQYKGTRYQTANLKMCWNPVF